MSEEDKSKPVHYKGAVGAGRPERLNEPTLVKSVCFECGKPVDQTGSFECPYCGKRIFIAVPETNSKL
jgi:DNA-directed RNA polymerase subunit RPC12/RpoP